MIRAMLGVLLFLLGWSIGAFIEWGATCCVIFLLSGCFSIPFDLAFATGIWIIFAIAKLIIKKYK